MDDASEAGDRVVVGPPDRPLPRRRAVEVVAEWISLIGPARMAVAGVSALAVVAAAAWLLRAGPPATEASLALADGSVPVATLPPPAGGRPDVVVHVAGAVAEPGVHILTEGDRVIDAIAAAGGELPDADIQALNLAAPVVDGQRIHVPVEGESPEIDPGQPPGAGAGPIDINRAPAEVLETLPGVGPATAAAIIDDRTRNGPFSTVDDLDRVSGIGPATLSRLRDLVTVR